MKDRSSPPEPDHKSIMADVRQSWRVVAASQQKIFYFLRRFEAENPELQFIHWGPAFNLRPPRRSTKPWERWNWDFLPLYAADYWFAPNGIKEHSELSVGNWFVVVRVFIDDEYTDEGELTASFNGPDPVKMPAVEDTGSTVEIFLYEVTKKDGEGQTPSKLWEVDESDWEKGVWTELPDLGARAMTRCNGLETLLDDNAITVLIAQFRSDVDAAGLIEQNSVLAPT